MAYVKKTNNPKMGRPSVNPRTVDLRVRLSEEENEKLNQILAVTGKTKTEVVVDGIAAVYDIIIKGN